MLVKVVGSHGGTSPGFRVTSYVIDNKLLIDAGSVAEGMPISEQLLIDQILISHPHLDHIKDLAFLCDNCFGLKDKPFEVYTTQDVLDAITTHLMNDIIWPDFSKLPNKEKPTIRYNILKPKQEIVLGEYKILPLRVNHFCHAIGFIIEKNDKAVLFTQDTGPTDEIWEEGKKYKNLKAIFTEVSFPNSLQGVATVSKHHTPDTMKEEIKKMPKDVPIFLGHLKPNYQDILYKEIDAIGCDRISLLGSDGTTFSF